MTAATLVTLALSLSLGQAHGETTPAAGAEAHPAAAAQEGQHAAPQAPRGALHEEPAFQGKGEKAVGEALEAELAGGHRAEGHGAPGHEKAGLSEVLMHHVTDGYLIEFPGVCDGHFAWNCEFDLKEVFGDKLAFQVGGTRLDMTPSKHLLMMWLASAVLLVAALSAVRRRNVVPKGLYNFVEMLVQFVRVEIAGKNIGARDGDRFVPYLVTAFFFILFVNLFGMIPYAATATGNIAVTLALATFTFVITQYAAIRAMGLWAWLKHLTGGVAWPLWPIMIIVELLGLFTKPFALTVRLFANMVAGHIVILSLLGLIFALNSPWVAIGSVPMALGIFLLELFVAFVQAYIFTMLSAVFIGQGLAHHGDHGEEHGHGHAEPAAEHDSHGSHVAGTSPGHG
jgi:F-type H+-transporting ATPase subunit a